jgi:NADPH:quinone reductase-like Zn-dependent oxidoreductase
MAAVWIAFVTVGCSDRRVDQAKETAFADQVVEDDEEIDEEQQKEAAHKIGFDNILLRVEGKEVRLAVKQLTWFKPRSSWLGAVGDFEFSGPDVSLRGTFPRFFKVWYKLQSVPISPRGDRPEPGESHLKLPGRGLVNVLGGEFSTQGAMTAGPLAVFGTLELKIGDPKQPETVRGTFSVRVKEVD